MSVLKFLSVLYVWLFEFLIVNWKGIQVIIGIIIISSMALGIFCNSSFFTKIWHFYCGKDGQKRRRDRAEAATAKLQRQKSEQQPTVNFKGNIKPTKSANWVSLRTQLKEWKKMIFGFVNQQNLTYLLLTLSTMMLVSVQVLFIHNYFELEFVQSTKKWKVVQDSCAFVEEYYMFEDLIYLPFSLLFLLVLYVFLQSRRFNNYIMVRFKRYFKSSFYKVCIQKKFDFL